MTTTEPTTEERITVIPEVTIPANLNDAQERAHGLLEEVKPKLKELRSAVLQIRDAYDEALIALWPHMGNKRTGRLTDTMHELASEATGWDDIFTALGWIGDTFGDDGELTAPGLSVHEIARGGERDFPKGTTATVSTPVEPGDLAEPDKVRVIVEHGPHHPLAEGGYLCRVLDERDDRQFICSHEEVKAGYERDLFETTEGDDQ